MSCEFIRDLFQNLNFWSALFGLSGTILIFFFGLPNPVNKKGTIHLVTKQTSEPGRKQGLLYDKLSKMGLLLVILSFGLQIVNIIAEGIAK